MSFHTRSNSFPSRPHPILQEVDQHLCRLRSSEATSTSSSSMGHKPSGLQDLYDCVDRLLQLPLTQHALSQEQNEKHANELLDGSLRLLDVCVTAKDSLLQIKESLMDLQSIIRRRGDLTSEVRKYLASRMMVKKTINKAMGNRSTSSSVNKDDNETVAIVSKLREVEAVTFVVFKSLMSFISGPKSQPRSWSSVSKIMQSKKVACEEETESSNEFAQVDASLQSLIEHKIAMQKMHRSSLRSWIHALKIKNKELNACLGN